MTKNIKIALIGVGTVTGIALLLAFTKKGKQVVKKVGSLIIPDSSATTDAGGVLRAGSSDMQHVMELQQALNDLTTITTWINTNCGIQWGVWPSGLIDISGVFDTRTASVAQFYLNRTEVDLDYLNEIRAKISAYNAGSNKCYYPLSINI